MLLLSNRRLADTNRRFRRSEVRSGEGICSAGLPRPRETAGKELGPKGIRRLAPQCAGGSHLNWSE
eukprot:9183067-Alexandrium_andersonii.AAC.1